jgi:excisionase family DNA binding protein
MDAKRVCAVRNHHGIPVYREGERQARSEMSVNEACKVLGVTQTTVLRLIRSKQLPAMEACAGAPWVMRRADVEQCMAERKRTATPTTGEFEATGS